MMSIVACCHSVKLATRGFRCCDQDVMVVPGAAFTKRTILLRSENPSGKCAKLHTVVASNNRDHALRSLYYCLFAPHITWVLFFARLLFVVNRTFNVTVRERL